jgi:hypothetical protein
MLLRAVFLSVLFLCGFCGSLRAEDCGARGYDGTEILKLDCQDAATFATNPSPFQIRLADGTIRGIALVPETDPGKSKFRVRLADGTIMALVTTGIITTCEELQAIPADSARNYELANNIDCSLTNPVNQPPGYTGLWTDGKGFLPLVNFQGRFDGKNLVISNLYINRSATNDIGLFSRTSGAQIQDLGLVLVNIKANSSFGSLVGWNESSSITNVYSTGAVSGNVGGGGLVGWNMSSPIAYSHSSVTVACASVYCGGLAGDIDTSTITNCYATGAVTGGSTNTGGFVGLVVSSTITNCYATGAVKGEWDVGGFAGADGGGSGVITNCYATGAVTTVSGGRFVGGFAGWTNVVISNCYSTGAVTVGSGSTFYGGMIGYNAGVLTNNWWYNTTSSAVGDPPGVLKAAAKNNFYGTGSPTGGAVYTGAPAWDFTNVWQSVAGDYPHLRD